MAVDITRGKGARHVDSMNEEIQTMIDFAGSKADSFFKDAQTQKKTYNLPDGWFDINNVCSGTHCCVINYKKYRKTAQFYC